MKKKPNFRKLAEQLEVGEELSLKAWTKKTLELIEEVAEECDLNPADVEAVVLGQIWNAMRDCFGIEQELENAYLEQHDEEYNK